jgi:hypothetical protein
MPFKKLGPFEGVNVNQDESAIPDNALVSSRNLHPVKPGGDLMLRRNSRVITSYGAVLGETLLADGGTAALFDFYDGYDNQLVVWAQGDDATPSKLFQLVGSSLLPITMANNGGSPNELSNDRKPGAVQWGNSLYLFTGGSRPGYRLDHRPAGVFDLTTIDAVPIHTIWAAGDMPRGNIAAAYRGTIALAGFVDQPHMIRWLEVGDPTTLVSASKAINVGREYRGSITALAELNVESGSAGLSSYLLVAKSTSMFIYTGNPPTTATDGDLSKAITISATEGCISKETLVNTKYGTVWCSGANVWLAPSSGGKPFPIGETIQSMLEQRAQSPNLWSAAFHDGFYRLTVPSGVTDPSEIALTETEQWWCDMRNYPKIAWWGPMELASEALLSQRKVDGSSRLYSAVCRHDADAKLYLEEQDVLTDDRLDHADGVDDLPWIPPAAEWVTKSFDWGDPHTDKLVERVELAYFNALPTYITISLLKDGGVDLKEETLYGLYHDAAKVSVSTVDGTDRVTNTFRSQTFHPPNGSRFLTKVVQVKGHMDTNELDFSTDMTIKSMVIQVRSLNERRQSQRNPDVSYGDGILGGGIDSPV